MLEFDKNDKIFLGNQLLKYFGNCLDCGICCKIFNKIEISNNEIKKIIMYLKITRNEFLKKYISQNQKNKYSLRKILKTPCNFQKSSKCTIQKIKPFDCRTFPLFINLTKEQAILTGIYLCPQATHFYQGFLDYCQNKLPNIYKNIIDLEKKTNFTPLGLELTISSNPLSMYIDWLYSEDKNK